MIRALVDLELRMLRHHALAIVRAPLRLAAWIPYAFALGSIVVFRITSRHAVQAGATFDAARATGLGGLLAGVICASVAIAASGRVAAYRSSAEAVMFNNAGISPLAAALWLQVRKIATGWVRWFGLFAYLVVLLVPRRATLGTTVHALAAVVLLAALALGSELPAFLLARGRLRWPVRVAAYLAAAAGFGYAAVGFAGPRVREAVIGVVRVDPGRAVDALLDGSAVGLALLAVTVAIMTSAILVLGRDAVPEIYAVSLRAMPTLRTLARKPTFTASGRPRAGRVPPGALAIAWKEWIAFRRGGASFWLWAAAAAFWTLCGAGAGIAAMRLDDASPLETLAAIAVLLVAVFAPSGAAELAPELGKPLFWLSSAPLRSRLAAWIASRALRGGGTIALAPVAAAAIFGRPEAALALPLCLLTYGALQAIGILLYSVFPNAIDARGPLLFVRVFVLGVAMVVPLAVAILALVAIPARFAPAAGVAIFSLLIALEGWSALEVASRRLGERGAALQAVARA